MDSEENLFEGEFDIFCLDELIDFFNVKSQRSNLQVTFQLNKAAKYILEHFPLDDEEIKREAYNMLKDVLSPKGIKLDEYEILSISDYSKIVCGKIYRSIISVYEKNKLDIFSLNLFFSTFIESLSDAKSDLHKTHASAKEIQTYEISDEKNDDEHNKAEIQLDNENYFSIIEIIKILNTSCFKSDPAILSQLNKAAKYILENIYFKNDSEIITSFDNIRKILSEKGIILDDYLTLGFKNYPKIEDDILFKSIIKIFEFEYLFFNFEFYFSLLNSILLDFDETTETDLILHTTQEIKISEALYGLTEDDI